MHVEQLKFDNNGILITNMETLLFLASKLCSKKGISSVVTSTEVTPPNKILINLRGGYSKLFEVKNNMIYEDSVYCISVGDLLDC